MKTIPLTVAQSPQSYSIHVGNGLWDSLPQWAPALLTSHKVVLISDTTVARLYENELVASLKKNGVDVEVFTFPAGEKNKNETTHRRLCHALLERHCHRDTLLLALGGGVVGDLVGYVAATTLRGLDYVHLPTTVLAMVDSSIGGKVGVNTPYGKNLLGAFHQPISVVSDFRTLSTLPQKQLVNGMIEALKMFLCLDKNAFQNFEQLKLPFNSADALFQEMIVRAAELKAKVVMRDEKEHGERKVLNFGHTVGHALEKISHYRLPHGFAVGLGIFLECQIALEMGILKPLVAKRIFAQLNRLGLKKQDLRRYPIESIIAHAQGDKKNLAGILHCVLLEDIGTVFLKEGRWAHPISEEILRLAYTHLLTS